MDILRIAVLGIAGVLLALLLQKEKSEYSMFSSLHLHFYLYSWKGGDCHQFCKKNADVCCSGSDVYHTDIKNGWDHLCGGVCDEYL